MIDVANIYQIYDDIHVCKKYYSRLPITRTLANSNLALTQTKIDFP